MLGGTATARSLRALVKTMRIQPKKIVGKGAKLNVPKKVVAPREVKDALAGVPQRGRVGMKPKRK